MESRVVTVATPVVGSPVPVKVPEADVSDAKSEADGFPGPPLPAGGRSVSAEPWSEVPEVGSKVVAVAPPIVQLPEPVELTAESLAVMIHAHWGASVFDRKDSR